VQCKRFIDVGICRASLQVLLLLLLLLLLLPGARFKKPNREPTDVVSPR